MMTDTREYRCPECGSFLRRDEDPYGVVYQCLAYDCYSLFDAAEIEETPDV